MLVSPIMSRVVGPVAFDVNRRRFVGRHVDTILTPQGYVEAVYCSTLPYLISTDQLSDRTCPIA
jgi:hypothetical protein